MTPPPHSTGAAVDLTLFDLDTQACIEMGSPIDEMSARSHPDYFTQLAEKATSKIALMTHDRSIAPLAAKNRKILAIAMEYAGFQRHPGEWWHFCMGDQMWAWLSQTNTSNTYAACYGRYDLLEPNIA